MNLGIFGGTFNPPHVGHLITAERVGDALGLDSILFIPSFISPHKQEGEERTAEHRLAMTRLAAAENPRFAVSDIEIQRPEPSYTIETVRSLRHERPEDHLFLIIGMDNFLTFHLWKEPKELLRSAALVVMNRPLYPKRVNEVLGTENVQFVDVPGIDVSSSEIRRRVHQGESIRYLVPQSVEAYIHQHALYR